jgi:YidC/Oxa1 family membrane protein insertase
MEKNTIFAFILSFLVLIIWFFISSHKQEKVPVHEAPQRKQATTQTESSETTVPQPRVSPTPPPLAVQKEISPIKKEEEKEISIETPLYSAVFSNVGPTIKSFRLKNYHLTTNPDSPWVELINMEDSHAPFLEWDFGRNASPGEEEQVYEVQEPSVTLGPGSSPKELVFSVTRPDGVHIDQVFRFYPDRYPIDVLVKLSNQSSTDIEGNLRAYLRNFPPAKKKSYYSFIGLALLLNGDLETMAAKKIKEAQNLSGRIGWIAYESDYFMSAVIPEETEKANFLGRSLPSGMLEAAYMPPPMVLKGGENLSTPFTIYLGPRDLTFLKPLHKKLELAINFGWTDIIAKPLLYTLRFFYKYLRNYGLAIILLTIVIKIIFWPLTHKSYKSMKEMQKLQPLMAKIREKYKNNREQMNKELMALYKTYKVNPMGGCLPMLIQMPVFFALYRILGSSTELRHAPFALWINDLSAPDRLFNFPFQIPFMSPPYGIPVLTLFMGASMFLQQKMTPTPGDPSQAKMMMFLPIVFTFLFINFPSGLVLYWLTNNIISIGQQYRIKKSSA